jgi:hypothetical protein
VGNKGKIVLKIGKTARKAGKKALKARIIAVFLMTEQKIKVARRAR